MESFIKELLEIAKECELSFDEVFIIFYDYGIVDEYGYLTNEALQYKKNPSRNLMRRIFFERIFNF